MACADKAVVSVQNPIRLDKFNQPQPDLAVLAPRDDFYTPALPGPADVLLVVEVADSSVTYDRTVKLPLYARFGIPEYWVVDLRARVLDVFRLHGGDYGEPVKPVSGEQLALFAAPE